MKIVLFVLSAMFIVSGCETAPTKTTDSPAVVSKTGISEVSPAEARPAIEAAYSQFIDVRSPEEYAEGHAYRARNLPLDTLAENLDKIEKQEPVYIICQTDNRSRAAAEILVNAGFSRAIVVIGGTDAWKAAGLPMGSAVSPVSSSALNVQTQKALISALEDERRAEATYQAVLLKFPGARPFVNIIEAEKQHQSFLLPLFAKYRVPVPINEFDPAKITVPETLIEACKVGVTAENENIALYDGFFEFVKEPDIREVFTLLQRASKDNHLPAFTRCAEGRGMGQGRGPGRRGPN